MTEFRGCCSMNPLHYGCAPLRSRAPIANRRWSDGGLADKLPAQKIYHPRPCDGFGCRAKGRFGIVHKGVAGPWVRIKFVVFAVLGKLGIELLTIFGGGVFVIVTEMALHWAMDFAASLQWRGDVASPCARGVAWIKSHRGLEVRFCRGQKIRHPATHAEADDADAAGVDIALPFEKIDRRGGVGDHSAVA